MGTRDRRRIRIIDSHTGGEPTRVVIDGWPELPGADMAARAQHLRSEHDDYRSAVVDEPRGSDHLVGAVLVPPADPSCATGVIFFNNVSTLGMCVHGTIGVITTLAHLERIGPGRHRLDTPVGTVTTELEENGEVVVRNVPSFRHRQKVAVEVEDHGTVHGDVAWGGNWFFLVEDHGQELASGRMAELTDFTWRIRQALERQGVTGADGAVIDHIELFGPPSTAGADSKNFVLCPGMAYDRSPCGTGTSAKLACLHADGKLEPGQIWRQESIIGSIFTGSVEPDGDRVIPSIRGSAFVNAEATLLFDGNDPFCMGIPEN